MFGAIAPRYDFLNRLLSFGITGAGARPLSGWSNFPRGGRVLDAATGTGDVAP